MLHGERVTLRAVRADELPMVYEWYTDVETWLLTEDRPYRPQTYEQFRDWWERSDAAADAAWFGVDVEGRLVGTVGLWGVDLHNRHAHVGLRIGERSHRGQGLGRDALAVLTDYGLRLRGLHRLQLETLASNEAMTRTALSVGYREEGRLRGRAFVTGRWVDEVVFGLLADDWHL